MRSCGQGYPMELAWDGMKIIYPYVVITIYVRTDGWLIIRLKKKNTSGFFKT